MGSQQSKVGVQIANKTAFRCDRLIRALCLVLHTGSESVSEGELGEDEGEAEEAVEEELDEIDLMLQLGIQLEEQLQEVEKQGLPPHIVKR